jgi:hypothetical protein
MSTAVQPISLVEGTYLALVTLQNEGDPLSELVRRIAYAPTLPSPGAGTWNGALNKRLRGVRTFLRDSDRLSKTKPTFGQGPIGP